MRTTRFLATALVAVSLLPMAALAETAAPVNQAVAQAAADKVAPVKTGAEHKAVKAEHKKAKVAKTVENKAAPATPATPAVPATK